MSRISSFAVTTAAVIVLAAGVQAQQAQQPPTQPQQAQMADRDEDFVKEIAQSAMVEIDSSKLAVEKASSPEIKAYAEKLIKDHTAASDELMALVRSKEAAWTDDDPSLKTKKEKHASLQTKTGVEFDKEYLEDMIGDHESTLARFGRQREYGKDADIKAFVTKYTPTVQDHLKIARDLRAKIK